MPETRASFRSLISQKILFQTEINEWEILTRKQKSIGKFTFVKFNVFVKI